MKMLKTSSVPVFTTKAEEHAFWEKTDSGTALDWSNPAASDCRT
jgi:hypothetical protein